MVYGEFLWRRLGRAMSGIESIVRVRVPGFDAGGIGDQFLPEVRGGFRVDVSEDEDAIVVVADLPGFEQEKITVCLLSPTNLWITSERQRRGRRRGKDRAEREGLRADEPAWSPSRTLQLPKARAPRSPTACSKSG